MIPESEVSRLRADYAQFEKEREKCQLKGENRMADHYEWRMSKIIDRLSKDDLSPWEDR